MLLFTIAPIYVLFGLVAAQLALFNQIEDILGSSAVAALYTNPVALGVAASALAAGRTQPSDIASLTANPT